MIEPTKCAAVIPCFNEGAGVASLVEAVRRQISSSAASGIGTLRNAGLNIDRRIIVVDDGSADDTSLRAAAAGATVLRHERNLGKGAALKTGLSHVLKSGFEWAVTLDGDGQHSAEDIPALLKRAQETGARLVIGNRMDNARAMPWLRRQVNCWMSRKLSQRAGRHLPDTQCGFRLIHLRTWAPLLLRAEHFEVESEMLMAFLAAGQPVEFVPVRVINRTRASHIRPVADTLRWWKWWRGLKSSRSGSIKTAGDRRVAPALDFDGPLSVERRH